MKAYEVDRKTRKSLNANDIALIHIVLDEVRRKGWEKSGLGSITFEDMCKLDTKLNYWLNTKVYGMVWDEEEGWKVPYTVTDDFNPTYDTDEWQ